MNMVAVELNLSLLQALSLGAGPPGATGFSFLTGLRVSWGVYVGSFKSPKKVKSEEQKLNLASVVELLDRTQRRLPQAYYP